MWKQKMHITFWSETLKGRDQRDSSVLIKLDVMLLTVSFILKNFELLKFKKDKL
jgi:hypothetical protein